MATHEGKRERDFGWSGLHAEGLPSEGGETYSQRRDAARGRGGRGDRRGSMKLWQTSVIPEVYPIIRLLENEIGNKPIFDIFATLTNVNDTIKKLLRRVQSTSLLKKEYT